MGVGLVLVSYDMINCTLNKKSLNGRGKSMATVLRRKFHVQ